MTFWTTVVPERFAGGRPFDGAGPRRPGEPNLSSGGQSLMARTQRYDLVVLGGGTGGLVSAAIAAGMGARVALVEREAQPGGDCLWTGCVPSKSLLAAAELVHGVRHAGRFGVRAKVEPVDLAAVMGHVQDVQAQIAPHDSLARLGSLGVEVITATGRFAGDGVIEAGGRELRFRKAIVATGSQPVLPPIPGLEDVEALTNETVWSLRELPGALAVIGGGPIGCELGQAFARLGSRVSIIDAAERLLSREEPSASRLLAAALTAEGVDLRLSTAVDAVNRTPSGRIAVHLGGTRPTVVEVDRVLVAAGRAPRTDDLGLESAGIRTDGAGAVIVDDRLRTSSRRVFAVGDVVGGLAFTHVAAHHARVATPNALLGLRRSASTAQIPWVTFTDPEVAHVGLTEDAARKRWGAKAQVTAIEGHGQLDRPVTARAPIAAATLVGDRRGRLVGATIVGRAAGESIAELTAWIEAEEKIDTVSQTVHAYPTYSEAAARAADEHLRARLAAPRTRAALRTVLALARRLPRSA